MNENTPIMLIMETTRVEVDVAVVGGGVAGLWLLHRLIDAGYNAILLEANRLGSEQTICSQGIIHGGTKYTLAGRLTKSADLIGAMPDRWRKCLAGQGEVDLRSVEVLSDSQYLWSRETMTSKVATFFAGKVMAGRVDRLNVDDRPEALVPLPKSTAVYRLNEIVLDMPSLLQSLAEPYRSRLIRVGSSSETVFETGDGPRAVSARFPLDGDRVLEVCADWFVLTAGAGNEALGRSLGKPVPMQRRPLHMVMAAGRSLPPLYAHCIEASSTPRLTVSTHWDRDGTPVWSLGGAIAEQGVDRDESAQIRAACDELACVLPWIDRSELVWATRRVDRAELKQPRLHRPSIPTAVQSGRVITAWPTKLAFAPRLASDVLKMIQSEGHTQPTGLDSWSGIDDQPFPEIAIPPWKEDRSWSTAP